MQTLSSVGTRNPSHTIQLIKIYGPDLIKRSGGNSVIFEKKFAREY